MIEPRGVVYAIRSSPMFAAILDAAFDVPLDLRRTTSTFRGKATVTSDGYVMCDFVRDGGDYHPGAFVCSVGDLMRNARDLDTHIRSYIDTWDGHVTAAIRGWIGRDWRS